MLTRPLLPFLQFFFPRVSQPLPPASSHPFHLLSQVLGIQDITAKVVGSTNIRNVVRATFAALSKLESVEDTSRRRGVRVYDVTGISPEDQPSSSKR